MKKLAVLFVLVLMLFSACTENPVNPVAPEKTSKTNYELIQLPASTDKEVDVKGLPIAFGLIKGKDGGTIDLNTGYFTFSGRVTIEASLTFPENAFNGNKFFGYVVNHINGVTTFFPEMQFDKSLNYSVKITNIDLSNILEDSIYFAYIDNDGSMEVIDADQVIVDFENNSIEVVNAKIDHFSRYGFVRIIEDSN